MFSFLSRVSPYTLAGGVALALAAYLCLVNLNYTALWYDEADSAFIGKQLLEQGDIVGWDGMNLMGGSDGKTLNADFRNVLPPLTFVINALGIAITDDLVTGSRIIHAFLGIIALVCFYFLLRQFLGAAPRLIFFIFALTALSPQLLLFFRQSRYFAFMALSFILAVYLYERFWRDRRIGVFIALVATVTLAFFNQYVGGFILGLSLAASHLLFRARETGQREWLLFVAGAAFVGMVGYLYFYWLGLVGGGRGLSHQEYTGYYFGRDQDVPILFKIYVYWRDAFRADWLSWWVCLWFIYCWYETRPKFFGGGAPKFFGGGAVVGGGGGAVGAVGSKRGGKKAGKKSAVKNAAKAAAAKVAQRATATKSAVADSFAPLFVGGARLMLYGVFFVLFWSVLSNQTVGAHLQAIADLRYYMGAIPFLMVMKGLMIEWLWRRSRVAALAVFAALLLSSVGAAPLNMKNHFTQERQFGWHLFALIREVHSPYPDVNSAVADYLREHAEFGDTVYTRNFFERESMILSIGDHVRFCCHFTNRTRLDKKKLNDLGAPLFRHKHEPDWIVTTGAPMTDREYAPFDPADYGEPVQLSVFHYTTQRPEINFHFWRPEYYGPLRGVIVQKRIAPKSAPTAE